MYVWPFLCVYDIIKISDHKLVFARTVFVGRKSSEFRCQEPTSTGTALMQLNFFDTRVSLDQAVADINWDVELLDKSVEERYDKIHYILEQKNVESNFKK